MSVAAPARSQLARCLLACLLAPGLASAAEVDPDLRAELAAGGKADTLIVLMAKVPAGLLRPEGDYRARRRLLVETLRATADVTQADVRDWLAAQGIAHQPFWVVNMIQAELDATQVDALAARDDIARLVPNRRLVLPPTPDDDGRLPWRPFAKASVEWGVSRVHAPAVWATGITGQGVVIAGQDTGMRWTHAALKARYRGWNGSSADHNYNWHDAIHAANASCPADSPQPCDDDGHGTHTVGTMIGDDGAGNQIGVAPGATWIGCRNMNAGNGTPASYNECAQWLLAPTDLAGQNPNPDLAPDIVSNSWGCPTSEGCTTGAEIQAAIDTLVAGGIFFAVAAGNSGSSCNTITEAPAMLDSAFAVGSTNSSDAISSFSSRGPVSGANRVKPDVVAPGSNVRSAVNGSDTSYTTMSGTSMATPHVAGVAALLISANPALRGDPQRVTDILRQTAVPLSGVTQVCGGIPATTYPNPVQGYGLIDAWAALRMAETIFSDGYEGTP